MSRTMPRRPAGGPARDGDLAMPVIMCAKRLRVASGCKRVLTRAVLPHMRRTGRGTVVQMSSNARSHGADRWLA
jgi:hypothetical protein